MPACLHACISVLATLQTRIALGNTFPRGLPWTAWTAWTALTASGFRLILAPPRPSGRRLRARPRSNNAHYLPSNLGTVQGIAWDCAA